MKKYTFLLFATLIFGACISPNSSTKTAPEKVDFVDINGMIIKEIAQNRSSIKNKRSKVDWW